jgi:hypothetical protein
VCVEISSAKPGVLSLLLSLLNETQTITYRDRKKKRKIRKKREGSWTRRDLLLSQHAEQQQQQHAHSDGVYISRPRKDFRF